MSEFDVEECDLELLKTETRKYLEGEDFENLDRGFMEDYGRFRVFVTVDTDQGYLSELGEKLDEELTEMGYELHEDSNIQNIDRTTTEDQVTPPSWVDDYDAVAPTGFETFLTELDREGLRKTAQLEYVKGLKID